MGLMVAEEEEKTIPNTFATSVSHTLLGREGHLPFGDRVLQARRCCFNLYVEARSAS